MGFGVVLTATATYFRAGAQFTFGDGRAVKAISRCRVPIVVPTGLTNRGQVQFGLAFLEVEVLPGSLMLLLPLPTQSRMGIVLGLRSITALVLPSKQGLAPCSVSLPRSPEGHMMFPLLPEATQLQLALQQTGNRAEFEELGQSPLVRLVGEEAAQGWVTDFLRR